VKSFAGSAAFGRIDRGHDQHGRYRGLIDRAVEEPFALLIPR
jgi:hypothetical protein